MSGKPSDLTQKQYLFIKEYLIDGNATRSAIEAGYSKKNADTMGSRLLVNVKIKAYIDKYTSERVARIDITADKVLEEIARIAFFKMSTLYNDDGTLKQPHELNDVEGAVVSSFKTRRETIGNGEDREVFYIDEYKTYDKQKSLEMLCKNLGLLEVQPKGNDGKKRIKRVSIVRRGS